MKNLIPLLVFAFLVLFTTACGGDGPGGGVDCNNSLSVNQQIADEVDAISVAVQNYINDSSTENCNALKMAYQDYFDALVGLQDCANDAGVGDEWAASIAEAEGNIDDLAC